ncbi:hypothetical protein DPMN_154931 [Dreissena polymorpha]|uniref:Uncharacterized protein n=1 Tax=Dreissena polymorpha TaxID=45954 RepID=A0A9D4FQ94_DREPO|nr:hypothetical protein DPMN_154931 [Dreissena polymorpha]
MRFELSSQIREWHTYTYTRVRMCISVNLEKEKDSSGRVEFQNKRSCGKKGSSCGNGASLAEYDEKDVPVEEDINGAVGSRIWMDIASSKKKDCQPAN